MKKLVTLLTFLIVGICSAQLTTTKAIDFVGAVTSTERDGWDVPANTYRLIYNVTTGQLEIGDENENWVGIGSGGGGSDDDITSANLNGTILEINEGSTQVTVDLASLSGGGSYTFSDTAEIDLVDSSGTVTAVLRNGSIAETRLDAAVQAKLNAVDDNTTNIAFEIVGSVLRVRDSEGNTVDINISTLQTEINTDAQDLTLTGNILAVTGDPNTDVDLSPYLDNINNFVDAITVTGTTTKTITLERDGLPDLTANFTDLSGAGGDGNDFLTAVSESSGVLTFTVTGQTNPTFDLQTYLDSQGYLTSVPSEYLTETEGDAAYIQIGGNVDDADANPSNEIQTISLSVNTLSLSNGGGNVDLSGYLDNVNNFVDGITVTGTTTKTITLTRDGLPDLTANFTDLSGAGGDGNDFLTAVSESGGILTFTVTGQTNPTFDLQTYLDGQGYITTDLDEQNLTGILNGSNELVLTISNGTGATVDLSSLDNPGAVPATGPGAPNALEYARWTDGTTIEGLTAAEVRTDLNVENGSTADQTGPEIVASIDSEIGTGWKTSSADGLGADGDKGSFTVSGGAGLVATIDDDAITTNMYFPQSVNNVAIADNAVRTEHIVDNGVTLSKIDDLAQTEGHVIKIVGGAATWAAEDSGGGGLTTDQANRLANENQFKYNTKSANFSFTSEDIEISSGADIGKKVIVDSSADVEGELEDSDIQVGESLALEGNGFEVVAYFADGESGLFADGAGNTGNQITVAAGQEMTAIKKSATYLRARGSYTLSTRAGPDVTAPVLQSAVVENAAPSDVVLTYDENLDTGSVPVAGAFGVFADAVQNIATGVAISGTTVTVTLTSPIANGEVVTISYQQSGTDPIQDIAGNDAADLTTESVTNNVAAGGFSIPASSDRPSLVLALDGEAQTGADGSTITAVTDYSSENHTVTPVNAVVQIDADGDRAFDFSATDARLEVATSTALGADFGTGGGTDRTWMMITSTPYPLGAWYADGNQTDRETVFIQSTAAAGFQWSGAGDTYNWTSTPQPPWLTSSLDDNDDLVIFITYEAATNTLTSRYYKRGNATGYDNGSAALTINADNNVPNPNILIGAEYATSAYTSFNATDAGVGAVAKVYVWNELLTPALMDTIRDDHGYGATD